MNVEEEQGRGILFLISLSLFFFSFFFGSIIRLDSCFNIKAICPVLLKKWLYSE